MQKRNLYPPGLITWVQALYAWKAPMMKPQKTLHLKGKQSDPGTGGESDIRQEQKWIDDDTYVLSMYGTGHDGKTEQKFMEGTFKRKKK